MKDTRHYLKLEIEQLPDNLWQKLISNSALQHLNLHHKEALSEQIPKLSESKFQELKVITRKIWDEFALKTAHQLTQEDEWFSPEENEAWKDL